MSRSKNQSNNTLPQSIQDYDEFRAEYVNIKRSFITFAKYVLIISPIVFLLYILGAFDVGGFLDGSDEFRLQCEKIGADRCVRGLDTMDSIVLTVFVLLEFGVAAGFAFMQGRDPE